MEKICGDYGSLKSPCIPLFQRGRKKLIPPFVKGDQGGLERIDNSPFLKGGLRGIKQGKKRTKKSPCISLLQRGRKRNPPFVKGDQGGLIGIRNSPIELRKNVGLGMRR
jgi:hypothetical protein